MTSDQEGIKMKPYKGEIHNWRRIHSTFLKEGLGFKIGGTPVGHPNFHVWILTSEVVSFGKDCITGKLKIITLNSEYYLIGDELC